VHVTSHNNHMYGITQSHKKGKSRVLQKWSEESFIEYVKKMQVIRHPITHTKLKLKWLRLCKKGSWFLVMGF
jgi:hypothetical protein